MIRDQIMCWTLCTIYYSLTLQAFLYQLTFYLFPGGGIEQQRWQYAKNHKTLQRGCTDGMAPTRLGPRTQTLNPEIPNPEKRENYLVQQRKNLHNRPEKQ